MPAVVSSSIAIHEKVKHSIASDYKVRLEEARVAYFNPFIFCIIKARSKKHLHANDGKGAPGRTDHRALETEQRSARLEGTNPEFEACECASEQSEG